MVFGYTSLKGYHTRYFDSSSTKSVNDSGSFSFPIERGGIFSFDPGWDFSTDLQIAVLLGQSLDASALGWNKSEFVKMQGYEFGLFMDVMDAAMCRDSLQ